MDFCLQRQTGCLKNVSTFCCAYKRDLIKNNDFERTIEIVPRVIVFEKLKINNIYCQAITVRNTGMLSRRVEFFSEPNNEIKFQTNPSTELKPGGFISVDIYLEPMKNKLINRSRVLFVKTEHPDIVWEIPIIVKNQSEIHVPQLICLPKVPQNTTSYYQFVLYNPQKNENSFSICTNHDSISTNPIRDTILAKNYFKILIAGKMPMQSVTTSLVLTLKNGKSFTIYVRMEPSNRLVHISCKDLILEDTYMGLRSQNDIQVCNKSLESVGFQWSKNEVLRMEDKGDVKDDDVFVVSEFLSIKNKRGCIPAMSSITSQITFSPPQDFEYNDDDDSPFQIHGDVYLFSPILGSQSYKLHISGQVLGPDIQITTGDIDLGNIYMGQVQCITLQVVNQGPIPGEIYFKGNTNSEEIRCSVNPTSIVLNSGSTSSFQLSFYCCNVGKFLTKLTFKIKFGCVVSILLRGNSLPAKVKLFPDIFELGNVPMCIPQKRLVSIVNPLPVPVVVEPMVIDDGVEDPLILCVDYSNLPLQTRPATFFNIASNKSKYEIANEENVLEQSFSDFGSEKKTNVRTGMSSQISSMFQNQVLDDIPAMAKELLSDFKSTFPQNQSLSGIDIIDAALDCLVDRFDYFHDLRDKQNFLQMNWTILPSDAKEIAIESERIYLEANESKTLPFDIVPNSVGPSSKTIQLKTYPVGTEHSDQECVVDPKNMVSNLSLQYNCVVPVLEYNDDFIFSQPLYVYMESPFVMKFKNIDAVPGFVHFKVLPKSEHGVIKVDKKQLKFFIAPYAEIKVACSVIFQKVGTVALHGIFHLVGKLLEFPFRVEANVLPPKVRAYPEKLSLKQQVLMETRIYFLIENISPTVAQFSLSLKNEKYQFLEPLGGGLAPGQIILISIHSKFLDPGIYKNIVNIHLKYAGIFVLSIPLSFIVEGAPLKFEPNIMQGLDFGIFNRRNTIQNQTIQISNLGEKSYKLLFQKQKPKKATLLPVSVFNIETNGLSLSPKAQGTFNITVDTSGEGFFEENFSIDGLGEDNCRFKFFTFTCKCSVIQSKISWSKNVISLETGNPNEPENKIFDTVSLINTTPLVGNVSLDVIGCFGISLENAELIETSLNFTITEKSAQQIYVSLNKDAIESTDSVCHCFTGSIKCKVNNKTQKSLMLHAKIVNPGLRICNPKVTFLTPHAESFAHIELHNCSPLKASFNWKLVSSTLTMSDQKRDETYTKTLSEVVLELPDEDVPRIPLSIKPGSTEFCSSDEESSEDDIPSARSTIDSHDYLKKKKSSSISSKISSRRSLSILPSLSSRSRLTQNMTCRPLTSPKIEKKPVHVKDIFDFLGLSDPSNNSNNNCVLHKKETIGDGLKSEELFEEENSVVFQQKSGCVMPKCTHKAYLFLPILKEGQTLNSKYNLEVLNGKTETLELTVTNLRARIHVSKTYVDLGKEIWHKQITCKIKVTSLCLYPLKISLIEDIKSEVKQLLTKSHIKILSPKQFLLLPHASIDIECTGLYGFEPNFTFDIGLEVNRSTTAIPIRFNGSGQMPMILCRNLSRIPQKLNEIVASYFFLRSLFNNSTTKRNETYPIHSNSSRKTLSNQKQSNKFVVINSDESLDAGEIESELEIQRFLNQLYESNKLQVAVDKFHARCEQFAMGDLDSLISLKMTICRPIPWELSAYNLDMGVLCFGVSKNFSLDILFTGPGKLFLSARTRKVIPGMLAEFEVSNGNGDPKPFVFFIQSPDETNHSKYKNSHERELKCEANSVDKPTKSHNSHSFDIDESGKHIRKILSSEKTRDRYTKIDQTLKIKKNPLILAEICQSSDENLSGLTVHLNLVFTATQEFYHNDQTIEDYLLIDVHFGPTLPIILKGNIHGDSNEM